MKVEQRFIIIFRLTIRCSPEILKHAFGMAENHMTTLLWLGREFYKKGNFSSIFATQEGEFVLQ